VVSVSVPSYGRRRRPIAVARVRCPLGRAPAANLTCGGRLIEFNHLRFWFSWSRDGRGQGGLAIGQKAERSSGLMFRRAGDLLLSERGPA
jgi:hypothetical protein